MPAENVTLYPKFTPNTDTPYTVQHYTYPDGVTATLHKSETSYGTTGEQTAEIAPLAELLSDGYTMAAVGTKTILADGSTVVKCSYDKPIEFSGTGQVLYDLIPTLL